MPQPILIIEDDPNDVLFLEIALKKAGVLSRPQILTHGRQGLDFARRAGVYADTVRFPTPYLVFLDLKLPQASGLEVLECLRQQAEFDATVVLVLTSSSSPRDIDAAYRLRANAYLVKPAAINELEIVMQAVKAFWLGTNQAHSAHSKVPGVIPALQTGPKGQP